MNYRHAFHAGNFADVFKHAILARILVYLMRKDTPLRYIDTHSGIGLYDLSSGEAERTGEWRDGIGRLPGADGDMPEAVAALLAPYLDALGPRGEDGRPENYPGSPAIAAHLLRPQDRMTLCELHAADATTLRRNMARAHPRDRRSKIVPIDGYTGLNACVPPPERRGLVLIDPPFEDRGEFARLGKALVRAVNKWPTGVYCVWYPLKIADAADGLFSVLDGTAAAADAGNCLRIELQTARMEPDAPLSACGLAIVNPPWTLQQEAEVLLPWLCELLQRGPGHAWRVEQPFAKRKRA